MWQVIKEVFTAEGEQISREIQADHIPEREAVEIAATCTRLEEASAFGELEKAVRVYYFPQLKIG